MTDSVNSRMTLAALLCMAFGPAVFLLMPVYVGALQASMALSESNLGLLASADLIGIAVASFLAPLWINRVPWRLISLLCFVGLLGCNLLSMFIADFGPLFAVRLLAGLFYGCVAAVIAAIFSHSRSPDRVVAIAVVMQVSYQALAFLILPGIIEDQGLNGFLLSVVAVQMVAMASIVWFPARPIFAPEQSTAEGVATQKSHWPATLILMAMAAFFVGQSSLWAFIELIGNDFGLDDVAVGYALAVSTFIGLAGPIFGAIAGDRYGRLRPVLIAGVTQIVVLFFMDAATSVWLYAAMLSVFQIFWNLGIGYQFGALVQADHTNRFVVIVSAAQCAGIAAGPILGGMAMESFGGVGVYMVSGMALIVYLLLIVPNLLEQRVTTTI